MQAQKHTHTRTHKKKENEFEVPYEIVDLYEI